ncbi:putative dimethylaniline monooxygenase [Sclerotinia borealis F-4128]|uniref:Putative dimethylaniline monooxygenase n=1 Tax=Sclerotinia borealis (strain F-4128) TaxID=1432307 RepID=W9CM34_SCLBF|nr:putative dimethylaniline monooxygenase [Sclerotinia borealis F-4128]
MSEVVKVDVLVVDAGRGYDTFWTQWTVGTAEFSDQAMPRPPDEDLYKEFFKAKQTTRYLESYVDTHTYDDKTLRDRIQFSLEVKSVSKKYDYWTILASDRGNDQHQYTFMTPKLIIGSGLTSIPNMPSLPGKENFQGRVLHHEDFGSSRKISADMAYEAVKAGKQVSWVIKGTDTTGPGFFVAPDGKGPYKNAFEISMTRVAATFTPSFMNGINAWSKLLHSTKYGVRMMNAFWGTVDEDARKSADFHRKCLQNFDKLEPHSSIFWQNCTGGLLNHEDFLDTIAQNVRIFVGDIDGLEDNALRLKTGEKIPSDVILCGTGWVPSLQFFPQTQCQELGLPRILDDDAKVENAHWAKVETEADLKVLATFPQLGNPPEHYHKPPSHTPYRLYRHIAPISESSKDKDDRSIVFLGQIGVANYFPSLECQALWAMAYLDGKLNLPSKEEQEKDVALFTTWYRRRYLSSGEEGNNNMTFEVFGYMDTLLNDLGLTSHRKGWFKDLFAPLWEKDLAGLNAEFSKKFGYDEVGKLV